MENSGSGGKDGLDGTDGFPGVSDEEGDVAQLRHGRQELHVFGQAGLVLEGTQVRFGFRHHDVTRG